MGAPAKGCGKSEVVLCRGRLRQRSVNPVLESIGRICLGGNAIGEGGQEDVSGVGAKRSCRIGSGDQAVAGFTSFTDATLNKTGC